jgi:aminoglycoside phosphotransferase family enzyme
LLSFIDSLKDPQAYPHPTGEIVLRQTHISYLLLAGGYVYKIKKPVDFGFLDFTTLAKRKYYCEEELRLNRRLCPDIYLEVVAIRQSDKSIKMGGRSGRVIEYAVKMIRMPEERMMNNLLAAGELTAEMLERIVEILVPFYREAATGPEIREAGSPEAVGGNFRQNFQQTEAYVGCPALARTQFEAIRSFADKFIGGEELFHSRQESGHIRDGHGDLHSANICLAEKVHIFDCIEFNPGLRYCDVASDIAFLAMDLDYHEMPDMAAFFVKSFADKSGDCHLYDVLNYYKCYRAYVRGKIGLLTAHAPEVDAETKAASLNQAGRYFQLAESYAGGA